MIKIISLFVLAIIFSTSYQASAAVTPLSVSVVPPLQFPADDFSVTGLRLSLLWGQHRDLYGIDIGAIGNITEQKFTGIGVSGVFNYTKGNTTILGLQLAGLTNLNTNKTNVYGIQATLGLNMNSAAGSLVGVGIGLANISSFTDVYGAQIGIYNKANEVYGLQIGLINVASNLHGIQIGLLNFNNKGIFAVAPILNIGF